MRVQPSNEACASVHVPDDVAEFIARSVKFNVRELKGALARLIAYSSLTGGGVDHLLLKCAPK